MLNGKICLIADASDETGQRTALFLGKQGAKLILCNPEDTEIDDLFVEQLQKLNSPYLFVNAEFEDVTDTETVVSLIKTEKEFGRIDTMFYNIRPDLIKCRVSELSSDQISSLIKKYICKVFVATKVIGKTIAENKSGSLVYLSSINAEKPTGMFGYWSMYFGALRNLCRETALYYGVQGVRANSVEIGPMGGEDVSFRNELSKFYEGYQYKIPSGYIGTENDLASLVAYLMSDDSKYVNGAEIRMDGGLLLQYIDVISNGNAYLRKSGG